MSVAPLVQYEDDIFDKEPLTWLPLRDVNPDVAACIRDMDEHRQGATAPMMCVCGPAVLLLYLGVAVTWTFFLFFPIYAWSQCYCQSDSRQFAQYNTWSVWLVFVPFLVFSLAIEHKACSYAIATYVQVAKTWYFLGLDVSQLPYECWRFAMTLMHCLNHVSLVSNGLFMVRSLYTTFNTCDPDIVVFWRETIQQSLLGNILPHEFHIWACMLWLFMLLQPIVGLARTIPIGPVSDSNKARDERNNFSVDFSVAVSRNKNYEYAALLDGKQNHGSAMVALALTNRMCAISSPNFRYIKARIDMYQHGQVESRNAAFRIVNHLSDLLNNKLVDFLLVGIFENALSVNLQISLFALSRASRMSRSDVDVALTTADMQTIAGIVLTMFVLSLKLRDAWDTRKVARELHEYVDVAVEGSPDEEQELKRIKLTLHFFYVCVFVFGTLLLWAATKLFALWYCEYGLWNVGSGCVSNLHLGPANSHV
eukprot:TRINITY_DN26981_c0_g1_i1.p1 TRINITY_DN26981_c0_g1~~TRINITY_DN26981_c0_g1_i1.p1  ORF type:complete len:480 (+),score=55.67 TRINITY_DN26981_c0_g1_i1:319-1758(+)